jgi:hypothetical protein
MKRSVIMLLIGCALVFAQEIGARYLVITHDNFYNAVQPLAQWKHKKGLRTKVVKLSEIGSSTYQIRNYVVNAYNSWQIPPEYLLLIGAPNYLPFAQVNYTYTDNYYTNVTGDIYNEILSGRLTVHNTTEAQTVVNKILAYERTPNITDSLWFTSACLIARLDWDNDDSIYWSDTYHAADLMVSNGYTTIDTLSNYYGHNTNHVLSAINNGRSILMYRGRGVNNWYSPFDVNPDLTQNGTKLPIVLSLTCRTIGIGATPATAEKWLLTGSPAVPRGGAGYFATTTTVVGQAYLRSAVATGFFDAVFIDHKKTFGEACEAGRVRVYQMYLYQGGGDEYYGFTTIGDPSMNLWTACPKSIDVTHESSLFVGDDTLNVHVAHAEMPVESAVVCIVLDSTIYETGYTDNTGDISFAITLPHQGNMDVTVTGTNLYPYEGIVTVITGIEENQQQLLPYSLNPLLQVMPNPFLGKTMISVVMDNPGAYYDYAQLYICDVTGARIKTYYIKESLNGNSENIYWSGLDEHDYQVPPGVYFVQLSLKITGGPNEQSVTKKIIKLD